MNNFIKLNIIIRNPSSNIFTAINSLLVNINNNNNKLNSENTLLRGEFNVNDSYITIGKEYNNSLHNISFTQNEHTLYSTDIQYVESVYNHISKYE